MAAGRLKPIPVVFYRTEAGTEPVRDWLKGLTSDDRAVVGADLRTVQYGWPLGMPLCKSVGDGLWEVRCSLPSKREARLLFFFFEESRIAIVHGFIKKTKKTPPGEVALAKRRMREMVQ